MLSPPSRPAPHHGLALAAAGVVLGVLLGSLLGPDAWVFVLGAALGAGAVLVLLRVRARPRARAGRGRRRRPPEAYDLRRDRSTDGQRWPM
jgi:uncharacterized membrane protein YfcA